MKVMQSALCKLCRRNLYIVRRCLQIAAAEKPSKTKHVYRQLYPWKSKQEFVDDLIKNTVYNENGLIVISKPYGVPKATYSQGKEDDSPGVIKKRNSVSGVGDSPYSLTYVLPELRDHFSTKELIFIKCAERYTSGLVLLGMSQAVQQRVEKAVLRSKATKEPHMVFWVITKGYPSKSHYKEHVAVKLVALDEEATEKEPVVVNDFSKRDVKFQRLKPFNVECRTLCQNTNLSTSLLEISTSSMKWNFLRVFAASKTSCIIGDLRYSSRVRMVLGKPVIISPHQAASQSPQGLADVICERLGIPKGVEGHQQVPVMCHLKEFRLKQYLGKNNDLIIKNPYLPHHYSWTMERLNLIVPDQ